MSSVNLSTATLNQGKLFKKYQQKIVNKNKNLERKLNVNKKLIEGFEEGTQLNNTDAEFTEIKSLQTQLDSLLEQYKIYQNELIVKTDKYIDITNPSNAYSNKNIRFTDGTICYVTNLGVARPYGSFDIFTANSGNNGCPPQTWIDVNMSWSSSYTEGTILPTNPALIVGPFMKLGESCGNEGKNVYVNNIVNNQSSTYTGCYNDKPQSTLVNIIPAMTSNNSGDFIAESSSFYLNSYVWEPWHAFDQNIDTAWHCQVITPGSSPYNGTTGEYVSTNNKTINTASGTTQTINGEWLSIKLPGHDEKPASSYSITVTPGEYGNLNKERAPNTWYLLGGHTDPNTNLHDGVWYQLDYQENQNFATAEKTYSIATPGNYGYYCIIVTVVGSTASTPGNRYCFMIHELKLFTSSDVYFTDDQRSMTLVNNGSYDFNADTCQSYASDNGFQFFGLQDIQSDGNSQCLVSNDISRSQMYGESIIVTSISIWNSNTSGSGSIAATLSREGKLIVSGGDDTNNFETPGDETCTFGGGINSIENTTFGGNCPNVPQNNATDIVKTFIPDGTPSANYWIGAGFLYPVFNPFTCLGTFNSSYKCGNVPKSINVPGQSWLQITNYDCTQEYNACSFKLILQDDGNMAIYKNDSTTSIWASNTTGNIKESNPEWIATKGKYGVNYLTSGQTLGADEWIGSTNGTSRLIMQSDGNLVLYTSTSRSGCSKNSSDKMVGEKSVNAMYTLNKKGIPENINKVGYINSYGKLSEYPSTMIGKDITYQTISNYDSPGNDLEGMPIQNSSVETCTTSCNSNNDCAGFVFEKSNNNCWIKNNSMYPTGKKQANNNMDLYVRNPTVNNSSTCNKSINPIDSIMWGSYINSEKEMTPETSCGLAKLNKSHNIDLDALRTKIADIASQVVNKTNDLEATNTNLNVEMQSYRSNLLKNLDQYKLVNDIFSKYKSSYSVNMNGILSESDMLVLQENYSYMFWSILAIAFVIITINLKKK